MDTDFASLERELRGEPEPEVEVADPYADLAARYADFEAADDGSSGS